MTSQPNFLFLFPDQWRWDWLGCAGHDVPVRTPHIDALTERGVRFTQCRSNAPLCGPARAALATGLRPHRTGCPDNQHDTPLDRPTIFSLLRDAGYRVGTTGKNDLHKGSGDFSLTGWTPRLGRYGFTEAYDMRGKMNVCNNLPKGANDTYTSYLLSRGLGQVFLDDHHRRAEEATPPTADWPGRIEVKDYCDDVCGRASVDMLRGFPADAPWTLWVNFPGPHDPFDPPASRLKDYDGVVFPEPVNGSDTHLEHRGINHQGVRRCYAACCSGIDEWVGRLVDAVRDRGELDRTYIVFASDHGEMLGDHGLWQKCVPQEGSVRVPLVVAGPGTSSAATSNALIELIDIGATILDLADLSVPDDVDARSFRPVLEGNADATSHRDVQTALMEPRGWRMICVGRY